MDVEQMTLEQQHQPKGENWEVKYNALKKDFDYIQTVLDEQSSLNVELSNQVKKSEKRWLGFNKASCLKSPKRRGRLTPALLTFTTSFEETIRPPL